VILGSTPTECDKVQDNGFQEEEDNDDSSPVFESSCSEATKQIDSDGREWLFRSCLSAPMTLTPGGVINQANSSVVAEFCPGTISRNQRIAAEYTSNL